jgi:5-hydroxyisourate hydrolase
MATVSSHILDSVTGGSAVGIRVALYRVSVESARQTLFELEADAEGRIIEQVDVSQAPVGSEYELVFHSAEYFASRSLAVEKNAVMKTVVIRFTMTDAEKRYHLPIMLSPHSYSVWSSK